MCGAEGATVRPRAPSEVSKCGHERRYTCRYASVQGTRGCAPRRRPRCPSQSASVQSKGRGGCREGNGRHAHPLRSPLCVPITPPLPSAHTRASTRSVDCTAPTTQPPPILPLPPTPIHTWCPDPCGLQCAHHSAPSVPTPFPPPPSPHIFTPGDPTRAACSEPTTPRTSLRPRPGRVPLPRDGFARSPA